MDDRQGRSCLLQKESGRIIDIFNSRFPIAINWRHRNNSSIVCWSKFCRLRWYGNLQNSLQNTVHYGHLTTFYLLLTKEEEGVNFFCWFLLDFCTIWKDNFFFRKKKRLLKAAIFILTPNNLTSSTGFLKWLSHSQKAGKRLLKSASISKIRWMKSTYLVPG